jgi:hypothetical protein
VALIASVGVMALVVPTGPLAIDRWWSEAMQDLETPPLKDLALAFNALGRGLGQALSLAAVGLGLVFAPAVASAGRVRAR